MSQKDQEIENAIVAAGANVAPRLTPDDIDSLITATWFRVVEGTTTMFCCLKLKNGFTVTGESACVSPENFNEEIGREVAYTNAREKIWQLEGYLLKQRLYEQSLLATPMQRMLAEQDVLAGNLGRLGEFLNKPQPDFISDSHWELMKQQHEHMYQYHDTLVRRIADLQEQTQTAN